MFKVTQNAAPWRPDGVLWARSSLGWPELLIILAAPFMAVVDGFIVILAVPAIQHQLHASDAGGQMVIAGYVAAYASLLVAGGRLGDRYGRRRLLVVGLSLFTAFSLLCALAPDERMLVVARCLQGGSAALLYPQSLALLRVNSADESDLARAMAAWAVALGLASVVALVLGGLLVQSDVAGLGWRTVFLVNVPIGVVVLALTGVLPESRVVTSTKLDVTGMGMLAGALFALVVPLTAGRELGWPAWAWLLLGSSVALGRLYVAHERRLLWLGRTPLLALDLFRPRVIAAGLVTTLALYGGQLSFWVLTTGYLQRVLHEPPLAAGLMMAPASIGFFVTSTIVARLPRRHVAPVPAAGALAVAIGVGALAALAVAAVSRPALFVVVLLLSITGAGFGAIIPTLATAVLRAMPEQREGVAAGVLVTVQQAAAACGVALSGVLLSSLLAEGMDYTRSLGLALLLDVALFLVTAVLARTIGDAAAD